MLRTLGATSDALWSRLLDVHPSPASAVVVDISVFSGSRCLEVSPYAFLKQRPSSQKKWLGIGPSLCLANTSTL